MITRPGRQKTKSSPLKPSASPVPDNLRLIHKSVKEVCNADST